MTLRDYTRILRKRWRWMALAILVCSGAAAAYVQLATPQYQAVTQLFVSAESDPNNPNGLFSGSQFSQERVKSYAAIVTSPKVTEAVIQKLNLRESPEALASQISADAPVDTVLINVKVQDANPRRAKEIANAVSNEFTQLVDQLERPPGALTAPVTVSVVRDAALPKAPVSPQKVLLTLLGLGVGALLGAAAAMLRESLDTRVHNRADLESGLKLAVLGVIGYDSGAKKRPLLVHGAPQSARAESFRQLRTNLQFVNLDGGRKTIVVTSSVAEEGKTTTACNLAITLAEAGLRVTLVEADLRRPRLATYLGLEGSVGLTSVLIGKATLDDVLQPWGDNLFRVLCSGPLPPNPSELLSMGVTRGLLRELESDADLVILDAPPLLPVTDAAILAATASGAVLVVRAGRTKRDQIQSALAALQTVEARVLGGVLNMVPLRGPDAYHVTYGYGYGYTSDSAPQTSLTHEELRAFASAGRGQHDDDRPPGLAPETSTVPTPVASATAEDGGSSPPPTPTPEPGPGDQPVAGASAWPRLDETVEEPGSPRPADAGHELFYGREP